MPKGKRKNKSERNGRVGEQLSPTSDSDSAFDATSIISGWSDTRSVQDEPGSDVEDPGQIEAFEERLLEAVDGLVQKSAQGRTNCFDSLAKGLVRKFIPEFVFERRLTLSDAVERGLKKGRGSEQASAASLAPLLCVQLGAGDASEELFRELRPILMAVSADGATPFGTRARCCWALGLTAFLAGGHMVDVIELMQHMKELFSPSYKLSAGVIVGADAAVLHASALNAWSLLLTLMAPGDVYQLWNCSNGYAPSLNQLAEMLQSAHLDVRMAAGEAFALTFELGREFNEDFAEDFTPDLVDSLRQLATDSHKYRAKKDRKQQRATFRDILHFIEEDLYTDVQVRFGQEVLILDSWSRRKQYEVLCQTLGSGLNLHLAENDLLREVFQLGPRILPLDNHGVKQTKLERHLMNAANFKARTISRSKNRDKRSAVVAC